MYPVPISYSRPQYVHPNTSFKHHQAGNMFFFFKETKQSPGGSLVQKKKKKRKETGSSFHRLPSRWPKQSLLIFPAALLLLLPPPAFSQNRERSPSLRTIQSPNLLPAGPPRKGSRPPQRARNFCPAFNQQRRRRSSGRDPPLPHRLAARSSCGTSPAAPTCAK